MSLPPAPAPTPKVILSCRRNLNQTKGLTFIVRLNQKAITSTLPPHSSELAESSSWVVRAELALMLAVQPTPLRAAFPAEKTFLLLLEIKP